LAWRRARFSGLAPACCANGVSTQLLPWKTGGNQAGWGEGSMPPPETELGAGHHTSGCGHGLKSSFFCSVQLKYSTHCGTGVKFQL
jgi:hypothetical protein